MGRAADAEVTFVADDAAPLAIAFRRAADSRAARALPPSAPNSAAALLTLSPWPLRLGTGGVWEVRSTVTGGDRTCGAGHERGQAHLLVDRDVLDAADQH